MSEAGAGTLTVEFELSESDLEFFRERLDKARDDRGDSDDAIIDSVAQMTLEALGANPPEFVKERLGKLEPLVAMLRDKDWNLEGDDRKRVLDALCYFADPDDLIPDRIPGIGYIDDAIMIDLVCAALEPELDAYADFVEHREELKAGAEDLPSLPEARKVMQARMHRRRSRSRAGGRVRGRVASAMTYF